MLLNILQCTGQPPHQIIFWPKMSVLPLFGNPAFQGVFIIPLIKMRKLGLKGVKRLAQDSVTNKWWHQNLDTHLKTLSLIFLYPFNPSANPATCLQREDWEGKMFFPHFAHFLCSVKSTTPTEMSVSHCDGRPARTLSLSFRRQVRCSHQRS